MTDQSAVHVSDVGHIVHQGWETIAGRFSQRRASTIERAAGRVR